MVNLDNLNEHRESPEKPIDLEDVVKERGYSTDDTKTPPRDKGGSL
jgi:hypothetical protein